MKTLWKAVLPWNTWFGIDSWQLVSRRGRDQSAQMCIVACSVKSSALWWPSKQATLLGLQTWRCQGVPHTWLARGRGHDWWENMEGHEPLSLKMSLQVQGPRAFTPTADPALPDILTEVEKFEKTWLNHGRASFYSVVQARHSQCELGSCGDKEKKLGYYNGLWPSKNQPYLTKSFFSYLMYLIRENLISM